jgi:hypothetical protein
LLSVSIKNKNNITNPKKTFLLRINDKSKTAGRVISEENIVNNEVIRKAKVFLVFIFSRVIIKKISARMCPKLNMLM